MFGKTGWVNDIIAKKLAYIGEGAIPDKWTRFEGDEREREAANELSRRGEIVPLEPFLPFLNAWDLKPGVDWYESFCDDLAGELPFIEAFLLLLNSKNTIIRQDRDNFTKLNRLRVRARKTPLREFVVTRLRMSRVQGNRLAAMGFTREQARMHIVRGHFKCKKTGVFWWSPHPRGKGNKESKRTGYEVKA
jgi:hypothetical protein